MADLKSPVRDVFKVICKMAHSPQKCRFTSTQKIVMTVKFQVEVKLKTILRNLPLKPTV